MRQFLNPFLKVKHAINIPWRARGSHLYKMQPHHAALILNHNAKLTITSPRKLGRYIINLWLQARNRPPERLSQRQTSGWQRGLRSGHRVFDM